MSAGREKVLTPIRHAVSVLHGEADNGADTRRYADALNEARQAVGDVFTARDAALAELRNADAIIKAALKLLTPAQQDKLGRAVDDLGMLGPDGGITRHAERRAILDADWPRTVSE